MVNGNFEVEVDSNKMKIIITFSILVLIIGYLFKEKTLVINIKDTYFVMSYFSIAVWIVYGIIIFQILFFIVKWYKNK